MNQARAMLTDLIRFILAHDDWHSELDAAMDTWERLPDLSELEALAAVNRLLSLQSLRLLHLRKV